MKNTWNFLFLFGVLLALNSCKESDPCKNKDCGNGSCNDGACDCDPGYVRDASGKCTLLLCDTIDCVHGTCIDGVCDCDPGYALDANGRCTVKTCDGVDCVHGTCLNGNCNCDPGYETDANGKCTVVSRDKFLGAYLVDEDCSLTPASTYPANVTVGGAIDKVHITNFWATFFNPIQATVHNDTLTIARQEPDGDGFFVEGRGVYAKNASGIGTITFNYKVSDETQAPILMENCISTVYTKQ